jgi:type I restriction enzyme S subunit
LDQGFLWHWVQSPGTRFQIKKIVKGIHLYPKDVAALDIPLPPISEQRRIAAILDKADAIRRKHEQALALADGFLRSTFLHMFGDPVTNPKGLKRVPLREVATFTSGGTPSKAIPAFWEGTFPWVSPKDMKKLRIVDAQDHISAEAIVESNLKKLPEGTILIVVRGMILVHTVPIAMAGRELAINQDVKAINVDRRVCGQFAFWNLRVQHKHILARVGTAAHGTRRLDTETCERLPILLPNKEQQKDFCALASNFGRARDIVVFQLAAANALFASLSQQAFRGEL